MRDRKNLNEDPNKPLMNRFETTWVPGSTFKAITAAIGVESGKLDPNANFGDVGLQLAKRCRMGRLLCDNVDPVWIGGESDQCDDVFGQYLFCACVTGDRRQDPGGVVPENGI